MRVFLASLLVAGASAFVTIPSTASGRGVCSSTACSAVALPPLPYEYTALEPHISKETLEYHHDKHHAKYVAVTNELIKGTELESASLEDIVVKSKGTNQGLFNNAAQTWNHNFYWNSLKAGGGGKPTGKVASLIDSSFGSYDAFRKEFTTAANTQFGSGWAWLVQDKAGALKVVKTGNADVPVTDGLNPLIVIDVWNVRAKYVDTFLDSLVNWDFANSNLK